MSLIKRNKLTAAMCAAALIASSSAASAAGTSQSVQPWLTLSAMSSSSSASTAATAAQDGDNEGGFSAPPLLPLAVILATLAVAIYIAVDDNPDDLPLSPG